MSDMLSGCTTNLVAVCAQVVGMTIATAAEWLLVQSSFGLLLGTDPRRANQNEEQSDDNPLHDRFSVEWGV
jgi:hypothetical protein